MYKQRKLKIFNEKQNIFVQKKTELMLKEYQRQKIMYTSNKKKETIILRSVSQLRFLLKECKSHI